MSIVVASIIGLVIIAIIAVPILISVIGSAGERNQNRAEDEEDRASQEREGGQQNTGG